MRLISEVLDLPGTPGHVQQVLDPPSPLSWVHPSFLEKIKRV